ncbi:hypothetical protein GCM10023334_070200 [Nonomuraea thailandensis]
MPTPEVLSATVPEPSIRAPFHWVVAVRVVAMTIAPSVVTFRPYRGAKESCPPVIRLYIWRE